MDTEEKENTNIQNEDVEYNLKRMQEILRNINKNPVFFVGSGLSKRYLNTPNWNELLERIAKEIGCDLTTVSQNCKNQYEKIAQELEYYCFRHSKEGVLDYENHRKLFRNLIVNIFEEYIRNYKKSEKNVTEEEITNITNQLTSIKRGCAYQDINEIQSESIQYYKVAEKIYNISDIKRKQIELLQLRETVPRAIITTNYDTLIENVIYKDKCRVYVGQEGTKNQIDAFGEKIDLYKIHGSVEDSNSIIITKEDYDDFFEKSKYLYAKIFTMFWEYPIIFIGYSISDRNIKDILTVMISTMTEEEKIKFQKHIWVVEYEKYESEERVELKKIELLNGKEIELNCFYLCHYEQLYEALNKVILSQKFGPLKFNISDKVIELLIEPLYQLQDKIKVVVRELLQNGLDSCKNIGVPANIKISLNKGVNEEYYLEVEDNGIGMDLNVIRDSFLTVGKSSKSNSNKGVVGKYGIGILSLFLLGDLAEIYTKREGGQSLSFKVYIKDEKKQVSWIDDVSDKWNIKNKVSGTVLRLYINKKIYEEELGEVKSIEYYTEKIGLDNYLVKNGNSISIKWIEENKKVNKIDCDEWFVKIDNDFKMYRDKWLELDMENSLTKDKQELKDILDNNNIILYNDMISKVEYQKDQYKQLKEVDIPFIIMDILVDNIHNKEIKTSLSRENMIISGDVLDKIANAIYELEIDLAAKIIAGYKNEVNNNEIDLFSIIRKVKNQCSIIDRLCDIFIVNNKICMTRENMLQHLEIWDCNQNYKNNCITSETPIVYSGFKMHKTSVADEIIHSRIICVSKNYLRDYMLEAESSYYGLKKDALIKVLNFLKIEQIYYDDFNSAVLWKYIKDNKQQLESAIDNKAQDDLLWFKDNKDLKNKLNGLDNYLIAFDTMYVKNSVDTVFGDVLERKISDYNINEIVGICNK